VRDSFTAGFPLHGPGTAHGGPRPGCGVPFWLESFSLRASPSSRSPLVPCGGSLKLRRGLWGIPSAVFLFSPTPCPCAKMLAQSLQVNICLWRNVGLERTVYGRRPRRQDLPQSVYGLSVFPWFKFFIAPPKSPPTHRPPRLSKSTRPLFALASSVSFPTSACQFFRGRSCLVVAFSFAFLAASPPPQNLGP